MKKRDAGYVVADTPWIVIKPNKAVAKSDGGCNGIQSMILENTGKDNLEYCFGFGWYTNVQSKSWHAGGCSNENVDKSGRCKRCLSVYKNMKKARHPVLFGVNTILTPTHTSLTISPTHTEVNMIPDDQMIGALVAQHLAIIQEEDITMDAKLLEAALPLHAKNGNEVIIREKQMFMVCRECKSHRVCRKQKNNATLCPKCSNKEVSGTAPHSCSI